MSLSIRVHCCAAVVAILFHPAVHGQDSQTRPDARSEARSVFDDFVNNWRELKNYDVTILEKRRKGGKAKDLESLAIYQRLVADHAKHRYFCVGALSPEHAPNRRLAAFYMNPAGGGAWLRKPDGRNMQVWDPARKASEFNKTLATSPFPDIRFVGAREYPGRSQGMSFEEQYRREFRFDGDVTVTSLDNNGLEVVETRLLGERSRFQRRYKFDAENPAPVHLAFILSASDGTNQYVKTEESISWDKIDGVFLPSLIQGTSRSHRGAEPEHYTVAFVWRVVNDSAKLPSFDLDTFFAEEELLKLLSAGEDHTLVE